MTSASRNEIDERTRGELISLETYRALFGVSASRRRRRPAPTSPAVSTLS